MDFNIHFETGPKKKRWYHKRRYYFHEFTADERLYLRWHYKSMRLIGVDRKLQRRRFRYDYNAVIKRDEWTTAMIAILKWQDSRKRLR